MNAPCSASASSAMIAALMRSECYPHAAEDVEMLETHISWVFLAGAYAYKLKKPVDLGFVDFTTLEKRRTFCEEELRLNRRLAPSLYVDVVEIRGTPGAPRINGRGPVLEHSLRMHRFPQEALASRMLGDGCLTPQLLDQLASRLAKFHEGTPRAAADALFGTCASVLRDVSQNFEQIASLATDHADARLLSMLRDWTEREFVLHYNDLHDRHTRGMTRECHGDLHLGNIVLVDGELVPFDCIEFSPDLRWIDVMSEVAFLFMDLMDRGADALAWRFLNAYLEASGDYSAMSVLRFYVVYRAMVRAKVHLMRAHQYSVGEAKRRRLKAAFRGYLGLAQRCTDLSRPAILLMHGFSGSGKSTIAQSLAERLGGLRIRADLERKRLHALSPLARSRLPVGAGLYGQDATQLTYARLADVARMMASSGYTAVLDATFLRRAQRTAMVDLASRMRVPIALIDVRTPRELLRSRILSRVNQADDPSDATPEVLEYQIATAEPVRAAENLPVIRIDGRKALGRESLAEISTRLSGARTVPATMASA